MKKKSNQQSCQRDEKRTQDLQETFENQHENRVLVAHLYTLRYFVMSHLIASVWKSFDFNIEIRFPLSFIQLQ